MSQQLQSTFSITRTLPAPPERVFAALSDFEEKKQWFTGPADWTQVEASLDFRPGGSEVNIGQGPDGDRSEFYAHYYDIVPNERIVYTYEMHHRGVKLSVSLATFELEPEGEGTLLTLTEHGVYLDGHEDPALREQGTRMLFDQLAAYVGRVRA
ncbi:polyketide cyclase [Sinomonas atrocyanea]|uniref:Polyketide cyclase n=3 Tax=Sinomonas atrocyanea TaxID=37927 RepID=A0A126ZYV2_9MICC|nr:SRPBCC family protein [Sinomonas atrocyanea]AMM31744.1 polyketide cyclase [Sinomonas atrocyanea]GEB66608.1 ATPase [Sinomonas atrocyanea]